MKNTTALVLVLLFALLTFSMVSDGPHLDVDLDGAHFDSPFGWIASVLFGGVGLLIGCAVLLLVGVLLTLVFAGVGMLLLVVSVLVAAVVVLATLTPVLLPLLFVIAIGALLMKRSRNNTRDAQL